MKTRLKDGVNWVGYIDWHVRDFHSYNTERGSTYNSYLVEDEKSALIDTVKEPYVEALLHNIKQFKPLAEIDYVISNHAEPDHSGSLPVVMRECKNALLVCDKKCQEILRSYYETDSWKFKLVKTGDTLSLGSKTLTFLETPMVHWPDSMCTYLMEDKILFSMDAFGQHFASMNRFDDEESMCVIMAEARTYYANIVMPFEKPVTNALESAGQLDIDIIAPSHGIIWRSNIAQIMAAYKEWVCCKSRAKALVVFDTMWNSTSEMASAIAVGAADVPGVEVKLIAIRKSNLTRIAAESIDAAAIAFGSATLNQNMMPMAAAVLTYLKGLKPSGKAGFAFGSYGWGKGAPEAIDAEIKKMKFEILRPPLKTKFKPSEEVLQECHSCGILLGEKALELAGK